MILRTLLLFFCICLLQVGYSQPDCTFEQYHRIGHDRSYLCMPVLHYQSKQNWYGEARYNYEDLQTFSLFAGRAFTGKSDLSYSFIPMLGWSTGRFKGVSAAMNIDLEYHNFFLSAQTQYSVSTTRSRDYFLYSWSELGYQSLAWLYTGLSVQHTQDFFSGRAIEPGAMIGFTFHKVTIPVYVFNPLSDKQYIIVGLSYKLKGSSK